MIQAELHEIPPGEHKYRTVATLLVEDDRNWKMDGVKPGVTCIDQDPHRIGNAAIERLTHLMDSLDTTSEEILIETELLERGSGELPPRPIRKGTSW
jgi:hypothetical protein